MDTVKITLKVSTLDGGQFRKRVWLALCWI